MELCDEEKAFLSQRKEVMFEAMEKLLGERGPKNLDEVSLSQGRPILSPVS